MSLKTLFQEWGTTYSSVAVSCDVSPKLFERVDEGRQPLPLSVAGRIAVVLSVELWVVVQAARSTTPQSGSRFNNPVPARSIKYLYELQPPPPELAETSPVTAALASFTL